MIDLVHNTITINTSVYTNTLVLLLVAVAVAFGIRQVVRLFKHTS